MSQYKSYLKYKDAEVSCLGAIPEHWENRVLKYIFSENKEKNTGCIENHILSLSYGNVISKKGGENFGLIPESFETYQIINPDYLVFRFTDLQNDHKSLRVGYSDKKGIITSAYLGLKKRKKDIHSKYYYYLFHSLDTQKYFYGFGGGVRLSINWNTLSKIKYPVPSLLEQIAIANFLDNQTTQIKKFIDLKVKTIELLKERKTAIINQAVTKGLDASVEMKGSGIEWLGEIPKHWKVKKLKFLSKCRNNQRIPIEASIRGQMRNPRYDYYGATGVIDKVDDYIYNEDLILIAEDGANLLMRNIQLVYIARGKYWVNNHAHIFEPMKFMDIEYLANTMEMFNYTTLISGSAQPKLTKSAILNIELPQPQKDEQHEIMKFIKEVSKKINESISQAEKEILLIKEYQQSLISEAVTGKIDVRGK